MTLPIHIWSDIACPWCFVGKARLEAALALLTDEGAPTDVRIHWRAFELDPRPREKSTTPYVERLAKKYNRSIDESQQMLDQMTQAIVSAGGECDFNKVIAANTFDAHRLIQWAGTTDANGQTQGAQQQLTDALMRAYLGRGLDLTSYPAMQALVAELGLNAVEAANVLDSNQYAEVVRNDEREAQNRGIHAVPSFLIGRYQVSGAQEPSALRDIIKRAQVEEK